MAAALAMLCWVVLTVMGLGKKVRFFCAPQTRLGLKTISGRKITGRGVKPVGQVQWQYMATYLYEDTSLSGFPRLWSQSVGGVPPLEGTGVKVSVGVVEPSTGEHFFFEFTHLSSDCFEVFLKLVSQQFPDSVLIIQLDNGGFQGAKKLKIPDNIILFFQPLTVEDAESAAPADLFERPSRTQSHRTSLATSQDGPAMAIARFLR